MPTALPQPSCYHYVLWLRQEQRDLGRGAVDTGLAQRCRWGYSKCRQWGKALSKGVLWLFPWVALSVNLGGRAGRRRAVKIQGLVSHPHGQTGYILDDFFQCHMVAAKIPRSPRSSHLTYG